MPHTKDVMKTWISQKSSSENNKGWIIKLLTKYGNINTKIKDNKAQSIRRHIDDHVITVRTSTCYSVKFWILSIKLVNK